MTIPVTLIVKAPNQQIEDQTVKCELSWTISRLKGHLSEVYPSKPVRMSVIKYTNTLISTVTYKCHLIQAQHEQKLIYSGQLLPDTVVLKDVLRNYDGQNTHTVHLVCAPSNSKIETPKRQQKMNETTSQTTNHSEPVMNQTASNANIHQTRASNINLNARETVPDFRTVWTSIAQTYPAFPDPNQYAVHAAIMQQAYAQYVNQYMQM